MADGLEPKGEFELGDEIIDGEHAAQIRLLDSFEKGLRERKSWDELVIVFDRLVEFTNLHFMSEELLMQRHAFPGIDTHVQEHDSLLDQVRKIQGGFGADDPTMTEGELSILRKWLVEHIQTKDRAFVAYLNKKNDVKK
jgi:hemerythrin